MRIFMSDREDEKLDSMLRSRRFEPAAPDLADRIALRARQIPQIQNITLLQWMRRLCAEFHLPKPGYVLACALILGLVVGLNEPLFSPAEDPDAVQVQSFLYADEGVL
jgi:hypothetical protein